MKKPLFILAILMATALASKAQLRLNLDVILGNRQPSPVELNAMQREEAAHPALTATMRNIHAAVAALQSDPALYGGHKQQAIADLQTAWVSVRKCLYYRLYADNH